MEAYRISRWIEPDCPAPGLTVRKALTAMSVTWVTHAWLQREMSLSARQVDSLLSSLHDQGALVRSGRHRHGLVTERPRKSLWSAAKANVARIVRGDPIIWMNPPAP